MLPLPARGRRRRDTRNSYILPMGESNKQTDGHQRSQRRTHNALVLAIKSDTNFKQLPGHHPARKLLNVGDQLSIAKPGETDVILLDGRRIVVPREPEESSSR